MVLPLDPGPEFTQLELSFNARLQFFRLEWLGDVIESAGFEGCELIFHFIQRT